MAKLLVVFPQRDPNEAVIEMRLEVYAEALATCTADELDEAVRRAIAEPGRVYMPTPGELIGVVRRIRDENEEDLDSTKALPSAPPSDTEKREVGSLLASLRDKMGWKEKSRG